jgi:hypothetical protein
VYRLAILMPAQRRRLRRVPAALLALLWAIAPVLGVVHGLSSEHRFCPEHQAFEESDGSADAEDAASDCADSHIGSTDHRDRNAHDECAFSQLLRRDASVTAPRAWSVAAIVSHQDSFVLISADVRPIAVLRAAPKNSPPTARA